MPSLSDVAPALRPRSKRLEFDDGNGGKLSLVVNGISAMQMADIGERFPTFMALIQTVQAQREAAAGDEELLAAINAKYAGEMMQHRAAIPAMIATGAGFHENPNEEAIAASFTVEAQVYLVAEIMELTNPDPANSGRKPLSPLGESSRNGLASEAAPPAL